MKRIALALLVAAVAVATVGAAVPAQASTLVSLGISMHDDDSHPYVYGEIPVTPALVLGVEYRTDNYLALSLWHGVAQGIYGEFSSVEGDDQYIELGGWRSMALSRTVDLTGWIGAQSKLGGTDIWAQAGAEIAIDVADSVALFAGGEITLLKKDGDTQTWVGVGYFF